MHGQSDVGDEVGWYRLSCSSIDDNFCLSINSWKHNLAWIQ